MINLYIIEEASIFTLNNNTPISDTQLLQNLTHWTLGGLNGILDK